jgi:hypothetical protein
VDEKITRESLDRLQIIDVLNRIYVFYDRRQWAEVRSCFTDEVDLDFTSAGGGNPAKVKLGMCAGSRPYSGGPAVFAGTIGVTLFGMFLTPVFFYVVRWLRSADIHTGEST